ncbi:unnamed protein product, partial [Prorocentrum cordatum]
GSLSDLWAPTTNLSTVNCGAETDDGVRGKQRLGLIVDPGAAKGLGGTDAVREICEHFLWPRNQDISVRNSGSKLSGIDGNPNASVGLGTIPLNLKAMPGSAFTMDLLGGSGSRCPCLLPSESIIEHAGSMCANILPEKDGVLVINHLGAMGKKVAPTTSLRILCADSGRYLLPIDDPSANAGEEAAALRQAVKDYMEFIFDTQTSSRTNVNAALQCDAENESFAGQRRILTGCSSSPREITSATLAAGQPRTLAGCSSSPREIASATLAAGQPRTLAGCSSIPSENKSAALFAGQTRMTREDMTQDTGRSKQCEMTAQTDANKRTFSGNAMKWIEHMQDFKTYFQERMAGSGRLSSRCSKLVLQIAFPIDCRYGWKLNLADPEHQVLLAAARETL